MDLFKETLDPAISADKMATIAEGMVKGVLSKKSKLDLSKYDWDRSQGCDLRDVRAAGEPCLSRHQIAPFARGSLSGVNGHALWLTCSQCSLRLLYVPVHGAKACYRSPGPLMSDTQAKLEKSPNATAEELRTKAISLDAAESSAKKQLEKIQREKEHLKTKTPSSAPKVMPRAPAIELTGGTMEQETGSKKMTKREHTLPPEQQEQESKTDQEWTQVNH